MAVSSLHCNSRSTYSMAGSATYMTGLETVMAAAAAEARTVKTVPSPAETTLMLPVTSRLHSVRMRLLLGKTQLQPAKAQLLRPEFKSRWSECAGDRG